jgi:hypothetical protein
MSGHSASHQADIPTTPEAFLADRQRMWSTFTGATLAGIITVVVILVGMAVFLV